MRVVGKEEGVRWAGGRMNETHSMDGWTDNDLLSTAERCFYSGRL